MNLPKDYKDYLLLHWREEDVETLLSGLEGEPSVSIRLNPSRLPTESAPHGADGHVPWCPEGIYLKERPAFTADPLLHAGAYYVQEASSMFLAHVLRCLSSSPSSPNLQFRTALDLCAAPGGKSTLLRSLLPDDCLLVCNEPIRNRTQVLAENMAKWGHSNVLVTQAHAAEIAHFIGTFDLILADVPCSGEGMFRKEPEAVRQWSPAFVADCAALQRSIVRDVWPALRPGGILIYSTCTFNPEEDEENAEWIARELGAIPIPIPTDPSWNILGDLRKSAPDTVPEGVVHHFLPGRVRGEGFFLAVLQKSGKEEEITHQKSIKAPKNAHFIGKRQKTHAPLSFPDALRAQLTTLPTNLLDESPTLPRVNLSLTDAIRYLQRESLVLPPETPRGHVTVCYRDQRLGLMNNLGSRANNLYPKEWRIRSGYVEGNSLFD